MGTLVKEESAASLPSGLFDSPPTTSISEHARLRQQIDVYKLRVDHQRKRLAGLHEQIVRHNLERARAGAPDAAFREGKIETEKNLFIDRLNKKLVALNTKISQNKELRKKIDEMRQERCRYDTIYTALEGNMQRNTETMALVLEKGKETLSRETKAVSELEALNKQYEENKRGLKLEQEELNKLLKMCAKMEKEDEEESSLDRRISRPLPSTSQKKVENNPDGKKELSDDEAWKRVVELTGTHDVDALIGRLAEKEHLHFGLFNRINEIEMEMSKNEARIAAANQELAELQSSIVTDHSDTTMQKELLSMEEKRQHLEANIGEVTARTEAQLRCWENFRSKIMSVHDALDLAVPDDLIGTDSITENNVMQYLAAIENKVSEVLTSIHGDCPETSAPLDDITEQLGSTTTTTTLMETLKLPSASAEDSLSDDSDDGERPFSFGELKRNLEDTRL